MIDPLTSPTGRLLTVADLALVEEIFSLAVDAAAADRGAIIDQAARPEIRDEVIELLAAHDRAESISASIATLVGQTVSRPRSL